MHASSVARPARFITSNIAARGIPGRGLKWVDSEKLNITSKAAEEIMIRGKCAVFIPTILLLITLISKDSQPARSFSFLADAYSNCLQLTTIANVSLAIKPRTHSAVFGTLQFPRKLSQYIKSHSSRCLFSQRHRLFARPHISPLNHTSITPPTVTTTTVTHLNSQPCSLPPSRVSSASLRWRGQLLLRREWRCRWRQ